MPPNFPIMLLILTLDFQGGMDQEESHSHEEPNSLKSGLPKELQTILSMMTFFTKKMDPNAFLITRLISGFCKNCTILRSKILLVDEKGEPLGVDKGIYQHHVNMLPTSMGRGEPSFAAVCPDTDTRFYPVGGYSRPVGMDVISHVFASQAVENFTLWFTTPDGKLNSGYHSDGVPVIMGAEIVNYSPIPRKVYIVVDMEYLEGKQGQRAVNMPLAVTGKLTLTPNFSLSF
jgi:hypothetical protein